VNKDAFDKLKPNEQKAVLDAAKAAEERGWKLSQEEMAIKTQALKDAKIIVMAPTFELKSGLTKIGETIAAEWASKAGADGQKMLDDYKK
jgi:TRAP-type C4-dicarboxylate transport system substrate-binding protein